MDIRNRRTMTKRSALSVFLALALCGYALMFLSTIQFVGTSPAYELMGTFNDTRLGLQLYARNTYVLNKTSGWVYTNATSWLDIFDVHRTLMYSFPLSSGFQLTNAQTEFSVETSGYYTLVLDGASVVPGTDLVVLRETQNYTMSTPFNFLLTPGKVIFLGGTTMFFAICIYSLFVLGERQRADVERSRRLVEAEKSRADNFMRIIFETISLIAFPLFLGVLCVTLFGLTNQYVIGFLLIVVDILLAYYWIKLDTLVALIFSLFGYSTILTMRRYSYVLASVVIFSYIFIFAPSILPVPIMFNFGSIFLFIILPVLLLVIFLLPLTDPLGYCSEAELCLREFLLAYRRDPQKADFGFIKQASKCIVHLLRSCGRVTPAKALQEKITSDILLTSKNRDMDKEDLLASRLLASLSPLNIAELNSAIGQVPEDNGRFLRIKPALEFLFYLTAVLAVIVPSILTILKVTGILL